MGPALARQQLQEAQTYRLLGYRAGNLVYRCLNGAMLDDLLVFHSSPKTSQAGLVGGPAMVAVDEVITQIPSYFIDPELACPATTFYRSVHAQGHLIELKALSDKARALEALMHKYQPEGGYLPLNQARYERTLGGLLVFALQIEQLTGRHKLGQNRNASQLTALIEALWERGEPGDPRAIELVLRANPKLERPEFLKGPAGSWLVPQLEPAELNAAVALTEGQYWQQGVPAAVIAESFAHSTVWVGAKLGDELVATARALSDGAKLAYVADVAVAPHCRGLGIGTRCLGLLLDHPSLRKVTKTMLHTRGAQQFYARFGFRRVAASLASGTVEMQRGPRHQDG